MKLDLSFWRFVIIIGFAKSLLWGKDNETYYFHIGSFSRDEQVAFKIVILPIILKVGFAGK